MATPRPPSAATYAGRKLHGKVVNELGRRIIGGDYPPGTALPVEEALCTALGVSRTALREAIKVLAAKGLVEARPRVGTRVRPREGWNLLDPDVLAWRCAMPPDPDFLMQLAEMREIFEPAAAALAARHGTAEQLAVIRSACDAMGAARDVTAWVRADLAFHDAVLQATGNPLLSPLAAMIGSALESLLGLTARSAENFNASLAEHQAVLEAIERRDDAGAHARMAGLLGDTRALMGRAFPPAKAVRPPRAAAAPR